MQWERAVFPLNKLTVYVAFSFAIMLVYLGKAE